jgi:hypothetical protein
MATNYPHSIPMNRATMPATDVRELNDGMVGRMVAGFRHFWCGLRGHDSMMQFEKDRVFLQCSSCGHESPGWALTEAPPKVVLRGDARRHMLVRPRLLSAERRIA